MKIALLGAGGRMGRAVLEAAAAQSGVTITAAVVRAGSEAAGKEFQGVRFSTDLKAGLAAADVLLDFSVPAATAAALELCLAAKKPLVSGVTGMDVALKEKLHSAARSIPVLCAPNMSLGVALLTQLARQAAAVLGPEFDIEILEAHHRHKKDAPSGTALALGEAVSEGRGTPLQERGPGPRQEGRIGFASLRGGDLAGEHTVLFAGEGERLELSHKAGSRQGFAQGALKAAAWVHAKPAGNYSLADVLGPLA
ncbi:MAG TPA: 4-hydroxy-tetrahydrodipicolinate reductase [Gammaproteobacteria bacterium]|nr:4-hydroxy-tetrahydrodipicolinate reductase [Gammaproteobacteria bacterium]